MARSTTLTNEAIWEHTGSERSQIADLVESLSEQQLDAPSLCSDWRIRDVAGHIAWVALSSPPQVAQAVLLGGFKLNAVMTERAIGAGSIPIDRLVAQLRKGAVSRIAAPGFPPIGYLADVVIHHSDMTRPLGLDHTIPEERLVAALGRALTSNRFTSGRSRTKGLRLVATDVEFNQGSGPEVTGPGEALLLAGVGRPVALAELAGDGVAVLRGRITASA